MLASTTVPGLVEFDVVVGGGLMPGSLVLLGGEPGVGKTTLLLQVAAALARSPPGQPSDARTPRVLYASGEETVSQIVSKAYRLLGASRAGSAEGEAAPADLPENLDILSETSVERLEDLLAGSDYAVAMIDSVQTCVTEDSVSAAGSVATLRAVADRMMNLAKSNEITLVLAGHVTKDGQIAGPRLLEHLVDVVLYFDGSDGGTSNTGYRLLRCHKNRFGPTDEVGVFAMSRAGTETNFNANSQMPQSCDHRVLCSLWIRMIQKQMCRGRMS
jgi:DNA repair protein RadA/Sms